MLTILSSLLGAARSPRLKRTAFGRGSDHSIEGCENWPASVQETSPVG